MRRRAPRATFDRQLDQVKDDVLRLGARVEQALERAGRALVERDTELADTVRWDDARRQRAASAQINSRDRRQ